MNFLALEKMPAVLTLLIGVFVWQFKTLIDHEWSSPLLTYTRNASPAVAINDSVYQNECVFRVTNRSQTVFRNLDITVLFRTEIDGQPVPDPKKVIDAEMSVIAPSALVDSQVQVLADSEAAEFIIPLAQPGNNYELRMTVKRNKKSDEYPSLYLRCDQPVELRMHDFRDWVVEHIFLINIIFLCTWLYLILLYVFLLLFKKTPKT